MNTIKEKKESITEFKNRYIKENTKISYENLNEIFYIENFFLNKDLPFMEEKFYETLIDIISNTLKSYIQELEYYVNIKPSTPQMSSDAEILIEEKDILYKYYLNLHIYYKKYHLLYLKSQFNTINTITFLEEIYIILKEFNEYSIKLQVKLIENLKKKLIEIKKEKIKTHESSIFN